MLGGQSDTVLLAAAWECPSDRRDGDLELCGDLLDRLVGMLKGQQDRSLHLVVELRTAAALAPSSTGGRQAPMARSRIRSRSKWHCWEQWAPVVREGSMSR